MKNILIFSSLIALLPSFAGLPASNDKQGFGAYEIKPFNLSGSVNIAVPFETTKATTFNYSYQVINAKSHIIYSSGAKEEKLFAKSIHYITYSAKPGATSVGENRILIRWRTSESEFESYHTVYFYGYEGSLAVNLNSEAEVSGFVNAETTYRFSGYPDYVGQKVKTTLNAPVLSGSAYFVHDLYFDFSALSFTTNRSYGARLYDSATLYTKDLSIFPRLSRLGEETVIPLELNEGSGEISFFPNFSLYVHEVTYIVTQYAYTGYVRASRLYFPKAKFGELNLVKFRLQINGYGYLKATLNLDFHLEIGATFLGQGGIHEAQIERH